MLVLLLCMGLVEFGWVANRAYSTHVAILFDGNCKCDSL